MANKLVLEGYISDSDGTEIYIGNPIMNDWDNINWKMYKFCLGDKDDYNQVSTRKYRITIEEIE